MRLVTWLLCAVLAAPGCATVAGDRQPSVAPTPVAVAAVGDRASAMATYARQLPIGSRVRADLSDGGHVRGTLMGVAADHVVINRRTRLPEPPVEVPLALVQRLELEGSSNVVKTVAIGVASGVAGALAVFAILAAIFSD